MMTTAIVHDHRGRCGNAKAGPIEVRLTIDRKVYYVNTGLKVLRGNLVGGSIVGQMDAPEMNERLQTIYSNVQRTVNDMLEHGEAIDVAEVRRRAWNVSADTKPGANPVHDWMTEQVKVLSVAEGTRKHYRTFLMRFEQWGEVRRWSDLSVERIYQWDAWLRGLNNTRDDRKNVIQRSADVKSADRVKVSPRLDDTLCEGTVYNYHKCFRAMLNRALKFGKIDANPYDRCKGTFHKGDKKSTEYLSDDEMQKVLAMKPTEGTQMAIARDLFVFQMFTGLAYSDAQAFDFSEYKKVKGVWCNTGNRIKTGVPFVSQLLPPAVEVLEKYGWRVPRMNNQRYNFMLKAIGAALGIEGLHSHLARHTFATWMLRQGVKIENVSKMLGHTNITQTQRYAKVLAESVHDDFERVRTAMMSSDGVATDNK